MQSVSYLLYIPVTAAVLGSVATDFTSRHQEDRHAGRESLCERNDQMTLLRSRAVTGADPLVMEAAGLPWKRAHAFDARVIDDAPFLLEQSYRLRYRVYCEERGFL